MNKVQPYITMFTKGQTFDGKVICVSTGSTEYQDKQLFNVCFRDPNSIETSPEPADGDFNAYEVVSRGMQSLLRDKVGQKVTFVIISPGRGEQLPWVKLDQQKIECGLDDVGKIVLACDCFKMASDLICNGKAEGFKFQNIQELSKRIADNVLTLAKSL